MRTINHTGIYSFDICTNITALNIEESITPKLDVMMILQMIIAIVGVTFIERFVHSFIFGLRFHEPMSLFLTVGMLD